MDVEITDTLRAIPLFASFRDQSDKLQAVAALMSVRRISTGSYLIREGDLGEELFILRRGAVEVTKTTLDNEQYTVALLRDEHHAFFGELALMDQDKRSATIKAVEDCEVLVLNRRDFEELGNRHPDIGLAIMRELAKILSRRFRGTNADVILLFEALVHEVQAEEFD